MPSPAPLLRARPLRRTCVFVPAEPLAVGDTVLVTVSRRVRSYAGIQMEGDYSQEVVISQEPRLQTDTLLQVPYGGTATLTVKVLPVAESAGCTLAVSSTSQAIASVQPSEVVMDATGTATFTRSWRTVGAHGFALVRGRYGLAGQCSDCRRGA